MRLDILRKLEGSSRSAWLLLLAAVLVGAASFVAILALERRVDENRRSQMLLTRVQHAEAELAEFAWDAQVRGGATPAAVSEFAAAAERELRELPATDPSRDRLLELHAALTAAVGQQTTLIAAGDHRRASAFDAEHIKPIVSLLKAELTRAGASHALKAERAGTVAFVGTMLTVALALLVLLLTALLLDRARRAGSRGRARMRLLARENQRLQAFERLYDEHLARQPSTFELPLDSIPPLVAPLLAGEPGPGPRSDVTELLGRDARKLLALADDLLLILNAAQGRDPMLELEPLDLAALARAAADANDSLLLRETEGAVSIDGNARRLTQLLLALVRAAVVVTPEGVPVQIGVSESGKSGVLEVRAPRLEAVEHRNRSHAALESRAGLDLALANAIALDHGGRLEVDIEDGGTTFRAVFPMAVSAPAGKAAAAAVTLL